MGKLTAVLAHELNRPLATIMSDAKAAQRVLARNTPDVDEVWKILKDSVADD